MKIKNQTLIFDILGKRCLDLSISETAELLDVSNQSISAYRSDPDKKSYREVAISPDEFYDRVFARYDSPMKQKTVLRAILDYLSGRGLLRSQLKEYAAQGYETFIKALLSFDLDNLPALSPEHGVKNPDLPESSAGGCVLNTVYPPTSIKFFGRKSIFGQIRDKLSENGIVLLDGIGGIGKSCISLKYIEKYKDKYRQIQHVYFEKSMKRTILKLSFNNLPEDDKTDDDRFALRMETLYSFRDDTLLIIDNMDIELEDLDVEHYIALKRSKIHILITSRYGTSFETDENILHVEELPEYEQLELFEHHYKGSLPEHEQDTVRSIFAKIGGHTLLIELVAKTMRDGDIEAGEMLRILDGEFEDADSIVSISKDQHVIQSTMDQYISRLFDTSSLDENESDVLRLLSLVPLGGIQRKLFRLLSGKSNNITISLTHNSWVITEQGASGEYRLRLHPVICRVVIGKTCPDFENCSFFLTKSAEMLNKHNVQNSPWFNDLAGTVHNLIDVIRFESREEIEYLFAAARRLSDCCLYGSALDLFESIIEQLHRLTRQPDSDRTILQKVYTAVAQVYIRLADYQKAIEAYLQAAGVLVQQPEGCEADLADLYNHLGFVYRKSSEYVKALDYYRKAEEILKKLPDSDQNTILGDTYNDLGVVYINLKDYGKALDCYQRGLEIRQRHPGADQLKLAFSFHNIGTVYQRTADYEKAIEYHKKALELRESCPEPPKLEIAASYAQLGNDYTDCGDFPSAEACYQISLEIRQRILRPNHPDIAWILSSIGDWNYKQGRYPEAAGKYKQVLSIREEVLGRRHAYTAEALYQLGRCYRRLHKPQKALEMLNRAREIQESRGLTAALEDTLKEIQALKI